MTTQPDARMVKARTELLLNPRGAFYASLAMGMNMVADAREKTLATDGRSIFYSVAYLDHLWNEYGEAQASRYLVGIIVHEVMHKAHKHHLRRNGRGLLPWNKACDYAINPDVLLGGFQLPPGCLIDPGYNGLSAEDIYYIQNPPQQSQPQPQQPQAPQQGDGEGESSEGESDDTGDGESEGDNGQESSEGDDTGDAGEAGEGDNGDGAGDDTGDTGEGDGEASKGDGEASQGEPKPDCDPTGCGGIRDAGDNPAELAESEMESDIAISQAIGVALRAAGGNIPADLASLIAERRTAKQDWRSALDQFLDPCSRKDYSWARPNRRFSTAPYVLPGMVSDGVNHVGIVVDVSSSIDLQAYSRFGAEAQAALDDGKVDKFTILYVNTAVMAADEYSAGDQITFRPAMGGGTRFEPAFRWFEENASDLSGVVYFTDMEACDWQYVAAVNPVPTLWAMYGSPRIYRPIALRVPFGDCIELID